jgi:hypothetical protein
MNRIFPRNYSGGIEWVAGYKCPFCDKPGSWRSGVHFDHMMRCGACSVVWEPEETYRIIRDDRPRILQELLDSIKNRVNIEKLPKEWGGHELRCFVAKIAAEMAENTEIKKNPRSRRARDFRNECKLM